MRNNNSLQNKGSTKRTCVAEEGDSKDINPFIKIPYIFSSQLPRTHEEVATTISTLNLSFIQDLPEGDKMELDFDLTHNMFKVASIFSLVFVGWGYVLVLSNPFKERNTWKGKVEAMEMRYITLQKELVTLHEEVKATNFL